MEVPNTDYPSEAESRIARKYNTMTSEMKFSPYWLDAPVKASTGPSAFSRVAPLGPRQPADPASPNTDIERYSDRFKLVRSSASGAPTPAFTSLHTKRKLDKELLPTAAFEAVFERKKRTRAAEGAPLYLSRELLAAPPALGQSQLTRLASQLGVARSSSLRRTSRRAMMCVLRVLVLKLQ